jgi:hypothetical protein
MPAGWQDATRNAAHNAGHRSLPERARRGGLFVVIIELGGPSSHLEVELPCFPW